jgi:DNA-binding MarR family transcriptional regulator
MPRKLTFLSPIHKASREIGVSLNPACEALGVGLSEGHLLSYLAVYGPCSISTLHRVFGLTPSTLTSMHDSLEKRRFLGRRLSASDRRSFDVEIAAEGRRAAAELRREIEALEKRIQKRVSAADIAGFHAVMAAIGALAAQSLEGTRKGRP